MINAPQSVLDALNSNNISYANLVTVNLGDAYNTGSDTILHLTDYSHSISYGGNTYTPDNNLTELSGISRKASTGSDSVEILFSVTDEVLIDAIRSERYVNKPTSIDRVIVEDGNVIGDFAIPIRTAWGLSHSISGNVGDRAIALTIDSSLGDLDGDNGWYAVNASHEQRHPGDKIMRHGQTVMTEEQQKKYTTNFSGVINKEIKPPALSKIYGYKNVELVPICLLKHRKTHTTYRHYFTTIIYAINIGDCDFIDIQNLRKDGDSFDYKVVSNTERDVGGWSVRVRTPSEAALSSLLAEENNGDLSFWFEGMDTAEKNRMQGMFGKGLTLLFFKNRNRDDWLSSAPRLTLPIRGSTVYDPRTGFTEFSRNPALQYADYLRSTEYGAGKRGISVSDANISDLADHFDQIPDSIGNPGINNILIDVSVDTGEAIVDNMNIWMEGVRLYTSDYYGNFNIRVESKSSVSLVINEDDLLDYPEYDSGEFTDRITQLTYSIKQLVPDEAVDASPGDLVEVDVEATFPPDGDPIYDAWLEEDGGIVNFESEQLSYVTELEQAYYWTMVDSRISRQPRELTLTVGAIGWLSEVGDVIQFSSAIMDMTDELWRVDEVSEDNGNVELSLVAYDNNFYTPDPSAIPTPAGYADPLTGITLSPVSGLAIIEKNGLYYLDWEPLSSANVSWYAVEILKDSVLFVGEPRVYFPPLLLESIVVGTYDVSVVSVGINNESDAAALSFTIDLPEQPTVTINPSNFSLEVIPTVTNSLIGTSFELQINFTNDFATSQNKGLAGSFTVAGLSPNTLYHLWVRTVNIVGKSDWVYVTSTTLNDNTELVNFVDLDRPGIINDAVAEMLTQVDDIVAGNPAQAIINGVNDILDNISTGVDVINEEVERKTETTTLTSKIDDNIAEIASTNQTIATIDSATSTALTEVRAAVNGNSSEIVKVEKAYTDANNALALDISVLNATVDANVAEIIRVDQASADADTAISLSLTNLTTTVNANTAEITSTQLAYASADAALASDITTLEANVGSTYATIANVSLVQADVAGNATAITGLTTRVTTAEGDIASANLVLDSHTTELGDLNSRVFLGTTTVSGEVERITGIFIADGTNLQSIIEFQADTLQLSDTLGNLKFYWNSIKGKFVFDGEIIANSGTFGGDLSAVTGTFSTLTTATDGYLRTGDAATVGTRVVISGPDVLTNYSIWVGNGSQSDANAKFFIKKDGTGFVAGEFFQGQLLREKYGSSSTPSATASGHLSAGNSVKVTATIKFFYRFDTPSQPVTLPTDIAYTIKRGATTIDSGTLYGSRYQIDPGGEPGVDWITRDIVSDVLIIEDTGALADTSYDYTIDVTDLTGSNIGTMTYNLTINTYENLVG